MRRNEFAGGRNRAPSRKATLLATALLSSLLTLNAPGTAWAQSTPQPRAWQLDAGPLDAALRRLGDQGRLTITYSSALVSGKTTPGLSGQHTLAEALERLLAGTGLTWEFIGDDAVAIKAAGTAPGAQAKPASQSRSEKAKQDEEIVGMPAIMVKGARTLNMDIERTIDDPQPYVVFDRSAIERSGSSNVGEFLKTRLPMNASARTGAQQNFNRGDVSSVSLRGLGESQTLILIDGRRMGGGSAGGSSTQPDINSIPLEAIERIEVLPTTASAIYGGAATGGVVNIIMRRDYVGTQATLTYDNSFDTDSAIKRFDVTSGFNLLEGRTSVLVAASYSESNDLLARDRRFVQDNQNTLHNNNPAAFGASYVVGAGANIRSLNGSDLVLKDGRSLGAATTSSPDGYAGISSDGVQALIDRAGSYNTNPSNSASLGSGGRSNLNSAPTVKYLSGSISHQFSDNFKGFLEASHSDNTSRINVGPVIDIVLPSAAAANPFQQDVRVYATSKQLDGYVQNESIYNRASGGVVFKLPRKWMGSFDYTYTESELSYIYNYPSLGPSSAGSLSGPIAQAARDGRIDILASLDRQDLSPYILSEYSQIRGPLSVVAKSPALRLSGPIASLPAGQVQLSFLLERQESDHSSANLEIPYLYNEAYPERSRVIDSAYLEINAPIISQANEIPWIEDLQLQMAGRWDKYRTVNAGSVRYSAGGPPAKFEYVSSSSEEFSPLVAAKLRFNQSLSLRASYSEGFLPPDINSLTAPSISVGITTFFADPMRGGQGAPQTIDLIQGGNPNLKPEYSKTWSAGLIYTPAWLEGLRMSVDYTHLKKEGNITRLSPEDLLNNEEVFSGRVVRGANLPGDPVGWAGPVIAMDRSYVNIASAIVEAFDMRLDYSFHASNGGLFSAFALATWQSKFSYQLVPSLPYEDRLGFVSGYDVPLKLKGNLGASWEYGSWILGWTARYTDSYYVADASLAASREALISQGNGGKVSSQTYHDIFVNYRLNSDGGSWAGIPNYLDGLEIKAGIRNIFNKAPLYDSSMYYPSHYYSAFGDARLATYYLSLKKAF